MTLRNTAVGLAVVVGLICAGLYLSPSVGNTKASTKRVACLSNLKQLAVATEVYRADADDRLPLQSWFQPLKALLRNPDFLGCFEVFTPSKKEVGYAMNLPLVGAQYAKIRQPASTVLFFETDALRSDVVANLAARNRDRHQGKGSNVSYADTHAKFIRKDEEP